jgi:hypothetical protein
MRSTLLTVARSAALSLVLAAPAAAQNLTLNFHDGLVTLEATSVPVRTILTEWGKKGGTNIVGADRLSGAPLTVKLTNVSEAKALEIVLRNAAGYMAAPRYAGTGPSTFDRILIMATTSAPPPVAAPRPAPAANNGMAGTQRFVPPRPPQQRTEQDQDEPDEPDDNPPNPPVFAFPQVQSQPGMFTNAPSQLNGQPVTVTVNPQTGAPQTITINPSQPGVAPTGPTTAARPGVIIAPPQPAQPAQPGPMIRPPGGNQQ